MKSLTAVRKQSTNYPVEFIIKIVELSHRPETSVAQLAREHGINDNLLFKWPQYWREGKLRPPFSFWVATDSHRQNYSICLLLEYSTKQLLLISCH